MSSGLVSTRTRMTRRPVGPTLPETLQPGHVIGRATEVVKRAVAAIPDSGGGPELKLMRCALSNAADGCEDSAGDGVLQVLADATQARVGSESVTHGHWLILQELAATARQEAAQLERD